jgi:hypothetical protein
MATNSEPWRTLHIRFARLAAGKMGFRAAASLPAANLHAALLDSSAGLVQGSPDYK